MGYRLNRLDDFTVMAGPKPMLTLVFIKDWRVVRGFSYIHVCYVPEILGATDNFQRSPLEALSFPASFQKGPCFQILSESPSSHSGSQNLLSQTAQNRPPVTKISYSQKLVMGNETP